MNKIKPEQLLELEQPFIKVQYMDFNLVVAINVGAAFAMTVVLPPFQALTGVIFCSNLLSGRIEPACCNIHAFWL